jgi:hypothetical protein
MANKFHYQSNFNWGSMPFSSGDPLKLKVPGTALVTASIQPTGDWKTVNNLIITGDIVMRRAINNATKKVAQDLADAVKAGIRSGAPGGKVFKPLKPRTLAIRRSRGDSSRGILMPRGRSLLNAIVAIPRDGSTRAGVSFDPTYDVTVKPGARGPDNSNLARIAKLHENGFTFVAPTRVAGVATGAIVVKVPARPFFAPVLKAHTRVSFATFQRMIDTYLVKAYFNRLDASKGK